MSRDLDASRVNKILQMLEESKRTRRVKLIRQYA